MLITIAVLALKSQMEMDINENKAQGGTATPQAYESQTVCYLVNIVLTDVKHDRCLRT